MVKYGQDAVGRGVNGETFLQSKASGDRLELAAGGAWVARHAAAIEREIDARAAEAGAARAVRIDISAIERLDTFGAWLIERLTRTFRAQGIEPSLAGQSENYRALLAEMQGVNLDEATPRALPNPLRRGLIAIGKTIDTVIESFLSNASMIGAITATTGRVLLNPSRMRFTAMVHHLDNVGWRAVPIILLITFLIGCIIAQQGIFHFRKFGADVYVVDMVGILVLREIGVLIVAIMVAGRSGSAYTAELGSMKMREEVDALRTMGFDPVEVLVMPRIVALLIGVPILTFIGSMAALYGGGLVCWLYGGIDPDIFLSRLKESITIDHFKVGMIKAPFMALIIGVVACVQGFAVKGSAESLGMQTTASVVESIFLVIVLDGLFAIFFASIGM
ncbi:MAG: ABC transporter permease [Pseudolabrys sp.]|nr:ABC transporter permease [Pseudolabrys sp.]MBV9954179.1 ABC transporter permease [Pseudolabrys sp.]